MLSDKPTFYPIGPRNNPRWLAPVGYRPREEAFAGWRPHRLASRLAWAAIKPALRWASPIALPSDNAYTRCIDRLDWKALGWRCSSSPVPLIHVGTPGPRRKAIVHLVDSGSHACELIVKVPLTEAAGWAIRHEAKTLAQLHKERFSGAPRLVEFDEAAGVASQTAVVGSHVSQKFSREIGVPLQALERHGATTSLQHVASRLVHVAASNADSIVLTRALNEIDDPTNLPAVRIHGDFAPWNLKLHSGAATLVDWEDSQPSGLPLHDAYHFVHMVRCLFGKRPRPMWQELRFRYHFALTAAQRRKLELAYLVQMLLREFTHRTYTKYLLATLHRAVAEQL